MSDAKTVADPPVGVVGGATICKEWADKIDRVLFTQDQIQGRIREMAAEISRKYAGKRVLAVGLLNGAFVFVGDFLKHLTIPYEVDFMVVSSYGHGTSSSGSIKLKKDLSIDPKGRHVLILEDLIDTGNTLAWIRKHLETKNCASIELACLLDKRSRRTADVAVEYIGFDCPDEFVVGYGMDFADEYRCIPFVGVLKPEAYSKPKA